MMMALAGCGASGTSAEPVADSSSTSPTNPALAPVEKNWVVTSDDIHLELATPDLGVGTQRFAIVLSDVTGLIKFPIIKLKAAFVPEETNTKTEPESAQTATAKYHEFPFGTRGLHSTEFNFDQPGTWAVSADIPRADGTTAPVQVRFKVQPSAKSVTVGEQAPASENNTLASVDHIRKLTTGSHRDPELYQYSVSEALERNRPLLIVFASPAFCTNAVCGPQVEVASELREDYGDEIDFIHVDLYDNPHEIQGDLSKARLSPVLNEWGLVSQEWTFIVGSDGVITHRFENFAPKPELITALSELK